MTAKEIIQNRYTCTCGEIYKSRKKKAPDCILCQEGAEIEDMMNEFAKQQAIEFATWLIKNASRFNNNDFDYLYNQFMEEKMSNDMQRKTMEDIYKLLEDKL